MINDELLKRTKPTKELLLTTRVRSLEFWVRFNEEKSILTACILNTSETGKQALNKLFEYILMKE